MSLINKMIKLCATVAVVVFAQTRAFAVCSEYSHLPDEEIEEYLSILQDPNKSDFKRSTAYNQLACSDNPVYRQHAFEIGIQDTENTLLRRQILLDRMFEKENFVIELIELANLSQESKAYIKENKGQIRFKAYKRDPSKGCITVYIHSSCDGSRQVTVSGNIVEITHIDFYSKFELTSKNTLEGYVVSSRRYKTDKIPAKLNLF